MQNSFKKKQNQFPGPNEPSVPRLNNNEGETTPGTGTASTQHRISIYLAVSIVTLATLIFNL